MKTSNLIIFSQKESCGLVYVLFKSIPGFFWGLYPGLGQIFPKNSLLLPRDKYCLIHHIQPQHLWGKGRLQRKRGKKQICIGNLVFTLICKWNKVIKYLRVLDKSHLPPSHKVFLRPTAHSSLTLNCRCKAGQELKIGTDVRTNPCCVILTSTLLCPQGTTRLQRNESNDKT